MAARPSPARPAHGRKIAAALAPGVGADELNEATSSVATAEAPVPFDRASDPDRAVIDALSADLTAAGRRARARKAQLIAVRPDPGFSVALRERLIQPDVGRTIDAGSEGSAAAGFQAQPVAAASKARQGSGLRRLAAFGLAGLVVAGAAAVVASGWLGATPANRAGEATDATLIRSGGSQALTAGTTLSAGDEIRIGAGGHATLLLGSSQARLAAGADVRLNVLSSSVTQVALLAGRAYDRVVLPAGGTYEVVTGPYTWTASGTAFDLNRTPAAAGGEDVNLLALEHSVNVAGPTTNQQIPEGSAVSVVFGSPASDGLSVGPIPTGVFSDPWLINNAKIDEALGFPIGALAGVALAPNDTPTAISSPTNGPTATPTQTPAPTFGESPSPSVRPTGTPVPTPRPTPTPSASPTPSPSPTATAQPTLTLSLNSCPGAMVLSWSKFSGTGFVSYVTLRYTTPDIPKAYSAQHKVAGTSTTSVGTTTADDPTIVDGATYFYRTLALGSGNAVLAASDVEAAPGFGQADLGPAAIGGPVVVWGIYNDAACFTQYRVLYYSANPEFTTTSPLGTIIVSSRLQTNVGVPPSSKFGSGDTIWFRVQVLRKTALGQFVVGQTTGTAPSYTYP
jgi:hypothetical protein